MTFNSIQFLLFLPCVFVGYWLLAHYYRVQNFFVLVVSYLFYGWWDWRFLVLIAFSSAWSYLVGLIELLRWDKTPSKALLTVSLIVNLGILGFFKYFDFFLDQAVLILDALGFNVHVCSLKIILPVGISFYTFQALSYTIDVYKRQIRPTRDPVAFFAFISFFPQLVAGPIERATNLLPQFLNRRTFDYPLAVQGCRQMLWGFFKKMVVADNCAVVANCLLNDSTQSNGIAVWLGILMFSIQIYGDFSGYSDIAIGCSRLFGIKLNRNFAYPYFSRDIAEFWRRWHISLTTWFRDYVYIPLGGSRCEKWCQMRNVFVVFLISGLWHGANWTFVLWGVFHAILFLPLLLSGRNKNITGTTCSSACDLRAMLLTFFMVLIGWVFFRAKSVEEILRWLIAMSNPFSWKSIKDVPKELWAGFGGFGLMLFVEWINRGCFFGLERLFKSVLLRYFVYYVLIFLIFLFTPGSCNFVYFQF